MIMCVLSGSVKYNHPSSKSFGRICFYNIVQYPMCNRNMHHHSKVCHKRLKYQKAEQFRVKPSKTLCVKLPDMSLVLLRDVRQMLLKLVELRSSDWGRVRTAAAASNATPDNDPNYFMVSVNCTILPICLFLSFLFYFFLSYYYYYFFKYIISVFLFVMDLFLPSQNEPTFYTEDGTPFTAADPGEAT